jgi:diguanylate cyclase (GGDEF)-like protein
LRNSLATVFFSVYLLVALILGFTLSYLVTNNQIDLIIESTLQRTSTQGLVYRDLIRDFLSQNNQNDQGAFFRFMLENPLPEETSLSLWNEWGEPMLSSIGADTFADELFNIQVAITKQDFQGSLFHSVLHWDDRTLKLYIPIFAEDQPLVLRFDSLLIGLGTQLDSLTSQLVISISLTFLLLLFLTFFTWSRIIKPILDLNKTVQDITQGKYPIGHQEKRKDEIGILRGNIFQMALQIRDIEEHARAANPLTGLPGNVSIELEIRKLLDKGETFALIYADLDYFKAFNDYYGVSRGDDMILHAKDTFISVFGASDDPLGFVGHQGGDDFVCICSVGNWESFCQEIISQFDQGVESYYDAKEKTLRKIRTKNRKGEVEEFDFVSISLSVVTNEKKRFDSFAEMAVVASEVKKYVKSIRGSAYHKDKRINK